jgi:hypothetical protein
LLQSRGQAGPETKLLLFATKGFDRNLAAAAASRDDVELIGLERLYSGA